MEMKDIIIVGYYEYGKLLRKILNLIFNQFQK